MHKARRDANRKPATPMRRSFFNLPLGLLVAGLACAAVFVAPSAARAAADVAKGEAIAKRWCASCHLVAADQTHANTDVPSFAAIAGKKESTRRLDAFLYAPHPKMPDMSLSRAEVADLVGYIGSLAR